MIYFRISQKDKEDLFHNENDAELLTPNMV